MITYVHHITIKSNDVREPKFKTIVIESTDTNAEMYEKMKALTAFERAVSTGFHLSVDTTVKLNLNKKTRPKKYSVCVWYPGIEEEKWW
jgi:hypothetical protein